MSRHSLYPQARTVRDLRQHCLLLQSRMPEERVEATQEEVQDMHPRLQPTHQFRPQTLPFRLTEGIDHRVGRWCMGQSTCSVQYTSSGYTVHILVSWLQRSILYMQNIVCTEYTSTHHIGTQHVLVHTACRPQHMERSLLLVHTCTAYTIYK